MAPGDIADRICALEVRGVSLVCHCVGAVDNSESLAGRRDADGDTCDGERGSTRADLHVFV